MEYKQVLKQLKPSKREREEMEIFTKKLVKAVRKITRKVNPVVCGSVAKDTWLSKKNEIDLFLLFSTGFSKKDLKREGLSLGKKIVKELDGRYVLAFSEHPYLEATIGKYQVDIVPCYAIDDAGKIKSSVDRTPLHVEFIQKKLKNPDEVRLLKQFCIVNDCYGADERRQAFSGYLCELLIVKYGSFAKLVKEASTWKAGKILGLNQTDKKKTLKKHETPLIFIDPVDVNRNAGAAVSVKSFYKFVNACKKFNKRPSKSFFLPRKIKPFSSSELERKIGKRETKLFLMTFKRPKVIEDVLYSQMRRFVKTVDRILMDNGFKIIRTGFYCNGECSVFSELESWKIPKMTKHVGPNVYSRHAENFLIHYKDQKTSIEDENWYVELEREVTKVEDLFKKMKMKTEKDLLKKGVPTKIAPKLKGSKMYFDKDFFKAFNESPKEFKIFFREWFEEDLF